MTTKPMTQAEALSWLAHLEKDCPYCYGYGGMSSMELVGVPGADPMYYCDVCQSIGKVPVLPDLRGLCPCLVYIQSLGQSSEPCIPCDNHIHRCKHHSSMHQDDCLECHGSNWVPNQGESALYQAMNRAGWGYGILQQPDNGHRHVSFWKALVYETDANDWLAAVKALKSAGYGGETDG